MAGTIAISLTDGYPPTWRFYAGMPGLAVGLLSGLFADSPFVVFVLGFLTNALFYYGVIKLVVFLHIWLTRRRKPNASS